MKWIAGALLLVAAVGVLLAGRGADSTESAAAGRAVPEVQLQRLDGGEPFALSRLASASTPTLLWFWAPWCEVCNAEAPSIERMASGADERLAVVAIGGRDDAANGPAFVERHRLRTPTMLFDEPMTVWSAYAIPGQPAAVLLDRDGIERRRWLGPFDPADVLQAADAL